LSSAKARRHPQRGDVGDRDEVAAVTLQVVAQRVARLEMDVGDHGERLGVDRHRLHHLLPPHRPLPAGVAGLVARADHDDRGLGDDRARLALRENGVVDRERLGDGLAHLQEVAHPVDHIGEPLRGNHLELAGDLHEGGEDLDGAPGVDQRASTAKAFSPLWQCHRVASQVAEPGHFGPWADRHREVALSLPRSPTRSTILGRAGRRRPLREHLVERLILAIRTDFGCLVIIVAFLIIMISTIVFADIITPPAANPFV
jgi:hypothetical protein